MNLEDQKLNGVNEIHLTDSLNAALLGLKIINTSDDSVPEDGDLFVYVDKSSSNTSTNEKKTYLFNLQAPLRKLNDVSDEFISHIVVENNKVTMKALVNRKIEMVEGVLQLLETPIVEEVDNFPLTLFEGENYIYTNYSNVNIELIYPKNNDLNLRYLNSAIYYQHTLDNDGEFCLDDIYFKDAFTKTEDKLNMEINNINVDNITSRNNKFSLDSDGNLIVNSITANNIGGDSTTDNQSICNLIYPVGSIYISVNDVEPSTLFGGTWEKLKDRFLLGSGDTYTNGNIGGSADLQAHSHTIPVLSGTAASAGAHTHTIGTDKDAVYSRTGGSWSAHSNSPAGAAYNFYTGNSGAHTHNVTTNASNTGSYGAGNSGNMPPYLVVNIWKRTA